MIDSTPPGDRPSALLLPSSLRCWLLFWQASYCHPWSLAAPTALCVTDFVALDTPSAGSAAAAQNRSQGSVQRPPIQNRGAASIATAQGEISCYLSALHCTLSECSARLVPPRPVWALCLWVVVSLKSYQKLPRDLVRCVDQGLLYHI